MSKSPTFKYRFYDFDIPSIARGLHMDMRSAGRVSQMFSFYFNEEFSQNAIFELIEKHEQMAFERNEAEDLHIRYVIRPDAEKGFFVERYAGQWREGERRVPGVEAYVLMEELPVGPIFRVWPVPLVDPILEYVNQ